MDRNSIGLASFRASTTSLSARRAWIEILYSIVRKKSSIAVALRKESVDRNGGRLPVFLLRDWSLSARRAWIEMHPGRYAQLLSPSLSARRAWIEIVKVSLYSSCTLVALRKESVDRNTFINYTIDNKSRSLSARRAWIEILWLVLV